MKIGVTVRFQNSYFSGSLPQVACAIARTLAQAGHDVTLLYPKEESNWFIDIAGHGQNLPPRKPWPIADHYDKIIEVVWQLTPEERKNSADQVIYFVHYPAVFYDMESTVYPWNPLKRSFTNLSAIWTYDHMRPQDIRYLEFLSNTPVLTVPYIWDADALDQFVIENNLPTWRESAKRIESTLASNIPPQVSWNARVMESNFSNCSHAILPLAIISQIRAAGDPIRFGVHNGEQLKTNNFFNGNIVRNLLLPDISGAIVPRVRLPDLLRDKTVFMSHQRFRPLKSYLLDALYLGIPMIHNCELLKTLGQYYYSLNEIQAAVTAWNTLKNDYAQSTSFFHPNAAAIRQQALRQRFSVQSLSKIYNERLLSRLPTMTKSLPITAHQATNELRVAFCNMWDGFQPKYNFFMYLLAWVGQQHNIRVINDQVNPNIAFFGPLSQGAEAKYPGIPKVYFSGENSPPNKHQDTFLNLGYQYSSDTKNYIRLPLWVLEINWFGADVMKIANPKPVELKDCMTVNPDLLAQKDKFCAFVATNPTNQNRNTVFAILNQWKHVDSGGRLFCNLPNGPIPAGLGGGGGELAKVEFYKQYKFAITYENSSGPGYTTEKLFHAKVAGAVPIYWGDPFVDRDFDSKGYINMNQINTAKDLVDAVAKIADNDEAWKAMASVPALSEYKRIWCEKTMFQIAKHIFKHVLDKDLQLLDWQTAQTFGKHYEQEPTLALSVPQPLLQVQEILPITPVTSVPVKRVLATACNMKYMECAVNLVRSFRKSDTTSPIIVYVFPDVPSDKYSILITSGASEVRSFPTTTNVPWSDFWDPQHFAWKLWLHADMLQKTEQDTSVLYLDSGIVIASSLDTIWQQIDTTGVFLINDNTQTNRRWCHPTFCTTLKVTDAELDADQIWAGGMGFKVGHPSNSIQQDALAIATNHRDAIVGTKWQAYSKDCLGHRHDQSILSVLTQRANCPRLPLKDFYCDVSMRAAQQWGTPLYVHRGNFKAIAPFSDGIDEAYVINLERRKDRIDTFKTHHMNIKDRVYLWRATDGRTLTLTQELVHCFRNNDFKWKKSVMGCALSHLGAWEKLANDNLAKSYLIMEDDVRLSPQWLTQWQISAQHIPKDADVIYLGGVLPPNKQAFPSIIEPINQYFAKVASNTLFQPSPRRYFHFCNYAYVLTQQGARKLCILIKEKGIFTSGDHMIVNHGDALLNIYFTTPLLATCFQDEDPAYQQSQFNNFSRIDNFDSDLWNNTECFSQDDIMNCLAKHIQTQKQVVEQPQQPLQTPHEQHVQLWNTFLREIALQRKDDLPKILTQLFSIWKSIGMEAFIKNFGWYRIFEQLIVLKNETLAPFFPQILDHMKHTFNTSLDMFNNVMTVLESRKESQKSIISAFQGDLEPMQTIFHMKEIAPNSFYELQWLETIYKKKIVYKPLTTMTEVVQTTNPIILYQKIPGKLITPLFQSFLDILKDANATATILHLSDEFANDDITFYTHPAIKHIYRNYWRKDLKQYNKVTVFPLGYANNRHATHLPPSPIFSERPHLWAFAGALDRAGREAALNDLRQATPYVEHATQEFNDPNQLQAPQYIELLRKAKFVPCFRGSHALESYRLYEALEHGAIPIYVPTESHDTNDEYAELFGQHPFLGFPSWSIAASLLPKLALQTEAMEKHRQTLQQWWANKKAELNNNAN